jgi:hypothetical protein
MDAALEGEFQNLLLTRHIQPIQPFAKYRYHRIFRKPATLNVEHTQAPIMERRRQKRTVPGGNELGPSWVGRLHEELPGRLEIVGLGPIPAPQP